MNRKNIYYWLLLPVLALMMGACGESNNDEELSKPDTPVTPVNPGDWQTVPAIGGTIEKGDIALTFPAGTFDADTKVAITEVKKGSVGGECEVSPFYQVTVPNATNKPITVKMKAEKAVRKTEFVVRAPGYAVSLGEEVLSDHTIPTTFSNGDEFTGTFPAFDASDSKESTSFTIGLVQEPDGNAVAAREITRADDSVIGKDRKVSWELKIKYWKSNDLQISESVLENYDKIKDALPAVNMYIKEAVKIIQDLGFKIPDGVKLNYYIGDADYYKLGIVRTSPNGYFDCSPIARSFDAIYLQGSLALAADHKVLKQTIIHETLHNFQSYYDMHYGYLPTGEHRSMYEIGSVWVEKFMDNGVSVNQFMNKGELNGQWLMLEQGLFDTFKNQFRLGLSTSSSDVKAIYGDYDSQGYSLGPLLYYMVSKNYSRGFDDTTVATLYDPFWGRINSSGYSLLEVLNEWYNVTFKENFFDGTDNINNYYLALWKGELMKHFNINNIEGALDDLKIKINQLNENNKTFNLDGCVYNYGCEGLAIKMNKNSFKDDDLKNQELVIKQEAEGLKTYLLYNNGLSKTTQYSQVAVKDEPIYLSGEILESLRKNNTHGTTFFLLTVRDKSAIKYTGTIPSQTSVELRDAQEKETMFERIHFVTSIDYTYTYTTKKETKTEEGGYGCNIFFLPEQFKTTKKGDNTYTVTAQNEINGIQYSLRFSYKDEGRDWFNMIKMSDVKDMEFSAIPVSDDAEYVHGGKNQHKIVSFRIGNDSPGVEYDYYDEDNYGNRYLTWYNDHTQLSDVTITYIDSNKSNVVFKNAMINVEAYYEFHKYY